MCMLVETYKKLNGRTVLRQEFFKSEKEALGRVKQIAEENKMTLSSEAFVNRTIDAKDSKGEFAGVFLFVKNI